MTEPPTPPPQPPYPVRRRSFTFMLDDDVREFLTYRARGHGLRLADVVRSALRDWCQGPLTTRRVRRPLP
jgi:hypothetical protein